MITEIQIQALIEHTMIGRQNAHTRAIRVDAQAALQGDKTCLEATEQNYRKATESSSCMGVRRIDRSPMNKARWCFTLLCGHEVWVTANRKPTAAFKTCMECP